MTILAQGNEKRLTHYEYCLDKDMPQYLRHYEPYYIHLYGRTKGVPLAVEPLQLKR